MVARPPNDDAHVEHGSSGLARDEMKLRDVDQEMPGTEIVRQKAPAVEVQLYDPNARVDVRWSWLRFPLGAKLAERLLKSDVLGMPRTNRVEP